MRQQFVICTCDPKLVSLRHSNILLVLDVSDQIGRHLPVSVFIEMQRQTIAVGDEFCSTVLQT